jgi:predicted nicotinamide N-methyase
VDRFAAAAIGLNARANGTAVTVTLADVLDGDGDDADMVLAGDVWYEKSMATRFLGFLNRASARGRDVLVGDPGRAYLPRANLEPVARYDVIVPRALEDADIKRTTVWRLGP